MNYRSIIFAGLVLFALLLPMAASAATPDALVLEGRALLEQKNLVQANTKFKQAVAADASHQEANFFYAITRLLNAVEADQDGPDPKKMDSIKELLDKFGMSQAGRTLYNWTAELEENIDGDFVLPKTTPTSAEIQTFVLDYVIPEIDGALANLSKIGTGFNIYVTPAMLAMTNSGFVQDGNTEIDYGDIALLKALFQSIKTSIYIVTAYNTDINIYSLYKDAMADKLNNINQVFVRKYPKLLKIKRSSNFAPAKESFEAAIDLYLEASDFIRAETDDQLDDLASIDPDDLADEAELCLTLADIKLSLDGPKDIMPGLDNFRDPTGDFVRVDLTRLFDSPADLRDYLGFTANTPCVPDDPTINGMFPYFSKTDWNGIVDSPEMLIVYSGYQSDGYIAGIFLEDEDKIASSVTAKGPGVSGTTKLVYTANSYLGNGWYDKGNILLGTSVPLTPQEYSVTVKDPYNTCTFEKQITGYVNDFAYDLSPSGPVSGELYFSWSEIPDSAGYSIVLYNNTNNKVIWGKEYPWNWNGTPYEGGPSLKSGKTYTYEVISWVEQDNVSNYSATTEQFTYQGIPSSVKGAQKATVYSWGNFDFFSGNSTGYGDIDYRAYWYQDRWLGGHTTSGGMSWLEEGNGIEDFKKWIENPDLPPSYAWSPSQNIYNISGKRTLWIKTRDYKYAMIFPVNVTNDKMEFYYVYPYGPNGGYTWSDSSNPYSPSSVAVADTQNGGELLITWQEAYNPGNVEGYKIMYGTNGWQLDKTKDAGKTTSYTLSGLKNGQTYYVKVLSYKDEGNTSWSNYKTATPTDGQQISPDIYVDTSSVVFEDVSVNNISGEQPVTIYNKGTDTLHVENINIPNTEDFAMNLYGGTAPCGTSSPVIPASGKCTVSVKFGPHSTGEKNTALAIISDDPDDYENPAYVTLIGMGISGEGNCFDGVDNDNDGATDCKDADCANAAGSSCSTGLQGICSEGTLTCSSGTQQCIQTNQPQEEGPLGSETCSDYKDNDCDGKTDSTDIDCASFKLNVATSGSRYGSQFSQGRRLRQ